ncbi:MAG: hypothetical protein IJ489_02995 [Clostridia bacterium]|nr:hypothetical protein [Clostridia bacterium]
MKRLLILTAVMLFLSCGCTAKTDFRISPETAVSRPIVKTEERLTVLINKNSGKYHLDVSCVYAVRMAEENRLLIDVPDIEYVSEHGYEPCSKCSDTEKTNLNTNES